MPGFLFRKPELIPKKWGYEICVCNYNHIGLDIGYALKTLTLLPTDGLHDVWTCSVHYHHRKHETFYVLGGAMFLEIFVPVRAQRPITFKDFRRPKGFIMYPGTAVTLEPHTAHRFWTQAVVTTIIEASTPDDSKDSYRLVKSGRRVMDTSEFVEVRPDGVPLV